MRCALHLIKQTSAARVHPTRCAHNVAASGSPRLEREAKTYSSATGSRSMAMRSSALPPPPTLYFSKK
jgi:hypothetical protein